MTGSGFTMLGLAGAFTRYRIMAWVTGVVLGTLTIWAVLGYSLWDYAGTDVKPELYRWLWVIHGWLYVIYLVTGVDLCFRMRYSVVRTVGILIAGTIPFMSFVAEYLVHRSIRPRLAVATAAAEVTPPAR